MSTQEEVLKPCPFCGSIPVLSSNKSYKIKVVFYHIRCVNHPECNAGDVMRPTKEEAVKRWNTRIEPEFPTPVELAEAVFAFQKIRESDMFNYNGQHGWNYYPEVSPSRDGLYCVADIDGDGASFMRNEIFTKGKFLRGANIWAWKALAHLPETKK